MSAGLMISDLLSIKPQESSPAGQMKMLPIEYIMPNPDNKIYVVGNLDGLKEDIRLHGVRQPLEVIRWANGYKLIGGERRLTACKQLKEEGDDRFSSLPCIIVESKGELDDKIALITANATARDLTDGERLAQYEALKDALTRKKKDGQLEGKVRDEVCRILGLSAGAAARLNVISSCGNEVIKERLKSGEIGLMQAYKDAQGYVRYIEESAEEPEAPKEQSQKSPVTVSELPGYAGWKFRPETMRAIEKAHQEAAEQAAKQEELPKKPDEQRETSESNEKKEPRGHDTLLKLASKTLDGQWELNLEEPIFKLSYYTQQLPGGATLWKQVDVTREEAGRTSATRYAITLQDYSFFTCGWLLRLDVTQELVKYFELK